MDHTQNPVSVRTEVYQFRVYLRDISPMIWRRLLLRSDHTLADLHNTIQITFGWTDTHLHCFTHRCRDYGIPQIGGPHYTADARDIRLNDLTLRIRERFIYEYDFTDGWIHEIRLEQRLLLDKEHTYPVCTGGARAGPPEDCGGAWSYLRLRQNYHPFYITERLTEILQDKLAEVDREEFLKLVYWAGCDHFDRRAVNQRLKQCCIGNGE